MFPLKSWLATCCLLLSGLSFSQQTPKTLLWRITGNGLQQPSYLFGTMHLNDKRLFHFGDSLYSAIERTEGFAIEVSPDEMAAYVINNMLDGSKSKKLEEILGADYDKYSEALARKLDKPADEITANDILKERNKWVNEFMEKGEMPTFMDAYLFDIARRQGKWVGGIEDIVDQAGILEELVDKWDIEVIIAGETDTDKNAFDKMIRLYLDQDIAGIDEMMGGNLKRRDILLIRRNVKMARRMDSLSAIRPTFFAVGAAHLPGDSGVVSLMRKRGFTVEPVFASKKIRPEDYKFKEVEIRWVTVSDKQQLYTVQMPGNPAPISYMGLMEMQFHMDISSNMGYCTMSVINPRSEGDEEEMYKALAERMFGNSKMNKPKKIEKNGVPGREFSGVVEGNGARVQIFIKGKIVYFAMVYSLKKDGMKSASADKFFQSFTITGNEPKASVAQAFSNAEIALAVNAPVEMSLNEKISSAPEEGWKPTAFTGADSRTGGYYMILERKVTPGLYVMNDSTLLEEYITAMRTQFSSITGEGIQPFRNGQGYLLQGPSAADKSIHSKMLLFTRGNRIYVVSAFAGSKDFDTPTMNEYFSSVELLPYDTAGWRRQVSPGGEFEAWSPAAIKLNSSGDDDEDADKNQYMSFDPHAATTFSYFTDFSGE
ncbi:MAG: GumN family protein [Chitinophagaceae bacterium]|nr:GumN family protein [Chitinophagaceae bacterium]